MHTVGTVLIYLITIAIWLVIARFVVDWVRLFARQWRPKGIVAMLLEMLYSITDPPMRAIGKVIPPIRLGQVMLDLSPMILLIALYVLRIIVAMAFT